MSEITVQRAGDVLIESLTLISDNIRVDLDDFLIELNIYEDIFSNFLRGEMSLSDSFNLIQKIPIKGEEFLLVKLRTPTFLDPNFIEKKFKIVQITDRKIVKDNSTQIFIINFVSEELIKDITKPIYRSYEDDIEKVVNKIFKECLFIDKPLKILTEIENKVKFVSPGWSPSKCINWLASKSIPKKDKACNFLFFETNKFFYYVSAETIFKKKKIGDYSFSSSSLFDKKNRVNREYFLSENIDMVSTLDQIKNYTNGYLANRLITLDVFNKVYELVDYDHTSSYDNYKHTSEGKAIPIFSEKSLKSPPSSISFYPINPKLYNDFKDNISEKIKIIHGNRKSTLLELTNLRLNLNVPGRTDIEVGSMLKFIFPELGPRENANSKYEDKLYTGLYIITAIRHKITRSKTVEHRMIMEIVKDSFS
jgi:hypothetical protein